MMKKQIRISAIIFLILTAVIWILPVKAHNISVVFTTDNANDGERVFFYIEAPTSYEKGETIEGVVCDNEICIKINPEYAAFTRISSSDENVINNINGLSVYSGNFTGKDYKVAEYSDNKIFVKSGNEFELNSSAVKEIKHGMKNPWKTKIILCMIVILVYLLVLLYIFLIKKTGSFKAASLCFIVGCAFFLCLYVSQRYDTATKKYGNSQMDEFYDLSGENSTISQNFYVARKRLNKISVYFQNDMTSDCDLEFVVTDSTDKIIYKNIIPQTQIKNNQYYDINLNLKNEVAQEEQLRLTISCINGDGNTGVRIAKSSSDVYPQGTMIIDDNDTETDLVFQTEYIRLYNILIVQVLIAIFAGVAIACVIFTKKSRAATIVTIVIYVLMFIYALFRMMFYEHYVGNTPDEAEHIGYIVYLEENNKIIPDFNEMPYVNSIGADNKKVILCNYDKLVNYLGHPPFYYNLMRLSKVSYSVNEDGYFVVNAWRLRLFSMGIMALAVLLMFYIGFTRLDRIPFIGFLYSVTCTSIPMMMYGGAGVSNDTLVILTVTIYFLGILRFAEKKRNILTYILIASGISMTLLSKLTAGVIVSVTSVIVVAYYIKKEKCIKDLLNYKFFVTIPIYAVALAYFLVLYKKLGVIQPSIFSGNTYEAAKTTGLYTQFDNRTYMTPETYVFYFFKQFNKSWTGISSHIEIVKPEHIGISSVAFPFMVLWFLPLAFIIKKIRNGIKYTPVIISMYIGTAVTVLLQLKNAYGGFIKRGYLGGFQSRYYICVIGLFAFALTIIIQKLNNKSLEYDKKIGNTIISNGMLISTLIFSLMMIQADFIYFLLNFQLYL